LKHYVQVGLPSYYTKQSYRPVENQMDKSTTVTILLGTTVNNFISLSSLNILKS